MTRQSATEIEQEAAAWVARLDREGRTPGLVAEIERWEAADPRRRGALLQAEAAWALLDAPEMDANDRPAAARPTRRMMLAGGLGALAAGIGATFLVGLPGERYRTTVGEIRRIPLEDGSIAAVNTGSAVQVAINASRRNVRLDGGEAWFQVARDPARPFEVVAGLVHVRAVGTAFAVRRRATGTDILVNEGVVEVWVEGQEANKLRVSAGGRASVDPNGELRSVPTDASGVDRALAWRAGKIDLANETLAEAAAEFNRYNVKTMVIADPALADERFHGLFRTDDPEGFAFAVRRSLSVPVEISASEIRIGRSSE